MFVEQIIGAKHQQNPLPSPEHAHIHASILA